MSTYVVCASRSSISPQLNMPRRVVELAVAVPDDGSLGAPAVDSSRAVGAIKSDARSKRERRRFSPYKEVEVVSLPQPTISTVLDALHVVDGPISSRTRHRNRFRFHKHNEKLELESLKDLMGSGPPSQRPRGAVAAATALPPERLPPPAAKERATGTADVSGSTIAPHAVADHPTQGNATALDLARMDPFATASAELQRRLTLGRAAFKEAQAKEAQAKDAHAKDAHGKETQESRRAVAGSSSSSSSSHRRASRPRIGAAHRSGRMALLLPPSLVKGDDGGRDLPAHPQSSSRTVLPPSSTRSTLSSSSRSGAASRRAGAASSRRLAGRTTMMT